ncbi:MAG: hypothetical protein U0003_05315 [Vampirovibrionales bacterium]
MTTNYSLISGASISATGLNLGFLSARGSRLLAEYQAKQSEKSSTGGQNSNTKTPQRAVKGYRASGKTTGSEYISVLRQNTVLDRQQGNKTVAIARTASNNTLSLGAGNHRLTVRSNNNTITTGNGSSRLSLGANVTGNTFNLGSGKNSLRLDGRQSDYRFETVDGSLKITNTKTGAVNTVNADDLSKLTIRTSDGKSINGDGTSGSGGSTGTSGSTGSTGGSGGSGATGATYTTGADTVTITTGNGTIDALAGNDNLTLSGAGADGNTINLNDGDDAITVQANAGDNTIDGGAGTDTITFAGNIDDYQVRYNSNTPGTLTFINKATGAETTVTNMEQFTFTDGTGNQAEILARMEQQVNINANGTVTTGGDDDTATFGNAVSGAVILGNGNNTVTFGNGVGVNQNAFGGSGIDRAVFAGDMNDYTLQYDASDLSTLTLVDRNTGANYQVTNFEQFTFNGSTVNQAQMLANMNSTVFLNAGSAGYTINTGGVGTENTLIMNDTDSFQGQIIAGGAGTDTLDLAGNAGAQLANYTVTWDESTPNQVTLTDISNPGRTLIITDQVESVLFSDGAQDFSRLKTMANQTVSVDTFGETVTTDAGKDTITVNSDGNTVDSGMGDDTLTVNSYYNTFTMGDGEDTITLASNIDGNSIWGGNGEDTLVMSENIGDFTIDYDTDSGRFVLTNNGSGNTTRVYDVEKFVFNGSQFDLAQMMGRANLFIAASGNGDTVTGGTGNDTIVIDGTNNDIRGADGDDTIIVGTTADGNTIMGNDGNDTVNYGAVNVGDISVVDNNDGTLSITANGNTNIISSDVESFAFIDVTLSFAEVAAMAGAGGISLLEGRSSYGTYSGADDTVAVGNAANGTVLQTGDGRDIVHLHNNPIFMGDVVTYATDVVVDTGNGDDEVYFNGTNGNDDIYFAGGAGTDTLIWGGGQGGSTTVSTLETSEYGTMYAITQANGNTVYIDSSVEFVNISTRSGTTTYTLADVQASVGGSLHYA